MQLRTRATPFTTEAGALSFKSLVHDGPLAIIFSDERLRLAPAKGARRFREMDPNIFEQTYFAHAMNVSVTAGILFESAAPTSPGGPATEQEMRIILAAGALHDFNKLEVIAEGRGLSRAFVEKEAEARKLLAGYVSDKEVEDVLHLALETESGTSTEAARYSPTMAPRRGTLAAWCLQLADRLAGSHADPNDAEGYRKAAAEFRARMPAVPEIRVKTLAVLPQASLGRAARQTFLDWIRTRPNCVLLHETERYVSWIGHEPTADDIQVMDDELWGRIGPSAKEAFKKAGASHNSLRTTWAESVTPTAETVDQWIEHFGGQLVIWQGSWGIDHFQELTQSLPGVFVYDKPTSARPKGRVRVELPPLDEAANEQTQATRGLVKLVIAHSAAQFLAETRHFPPGDPGPFATSDLEGIMGSTVPGILWARFEKGKVGAYESVRNEIATRLLAQTPTSDSPVVGFITSLLGGRGTLPAVGPTGAACIYCGTATDRRVKDALVFGIKPTAWAPRKKGVQRESQSGTICELCIVENQLRDMSARAADAVRSDAGYITAHIHAADLVCDVKWETLTPLLQSEVTDATGRALKLFPKTKKDGGVEAKGGIIVPLRGHVSIPIPKPKGGGSVSDTAVHLWRLRDCLAFARKSGFKLHISPLALVPTQERAHFRWTNPPAWMDALGLAEVHVDDLMDSVWPSGGRRPSAENIVGALLQAGQATPGAQGHRTFISRLTRNTLAVYDFPDARPKSEDSSHFIEILEDAYVPEPEKASLTQAAIAYIHFNARGEWSNNTWTWATRQYLDLRDRYHSQPDWQALVAGDLLAAAQRKSKGATPEKIDAFSNALESYLTQFRGGESPVGADQRVLINAIAYACKKNYRSVYPKEEPQ